MANNVKKLLQVSEEAAPLIQIPVMVGNEMFVLTQQDVRRTEDIRYLSYNRITPNVHLFPTAAPAAAPVNYFGGLFTPLTLPYTTPPNCPLQELFGRKKPEEEHVHFSASIHKAPRNVADVATQLAWSKEKEIEPSNPAPLRYSAATSTSSLTKSCACQHDPPKSRSQHTSCHSRHTSSCRNACVQTRSTTSSTASNTDSKTNWKPAASDMSVAESKNNVNRSSAENVSDAESKDNFNACNACVQTMSTKSSTASNTGSKSFWKPLASDMSVAESKNNVNRSPTANLSDAESKNKCNGYSESSVPAEESKCPSRHCKSQQTCTYSDGQSYHRCSPREGRFPQQEQQSGRHAQYQSAVGPQE